MRALLDDIWLAARMLVQNRGFAIASVSTLVLGIFLNTAVFSVVNVIWFRPLPFRPGGELVLLSSRNANKGLSEGLSFAHFAAMKSSAGVLEGAAAFQERNFNLTVSGHPERVWGGIMSHEAFELLGVEPIAGRGFDAGEQLSGAPVALIGESFWRSRLEGDPRIVGTEVRLDGRTVTIIGVLPKQFRFVYTDYDVIAPIPPGVMQAPQSQRRLSVLARLVPGIGIEQARARVNAVSAHLAERDPAANSGWTTQLTPFQQVFSNAMRDAAILLGAAALVLLIVCANVSNLFLAKAVARRRDAAIRIALGATRWSLIRQMFVEGITIGAIGGGISLLLSIWLEDILVASFPQLSLYALDYRVFAFTLAISLAAGVVFSVLPAIATSRPDVIGTLKASGAAVSGNTGGRLRKALVVSELAVGLMLLAATGLLLKSMVKMRYVDSGLDTRKLVVSTVALDGAGYEHPEARERFAGRLTERLRAVPGFDGAALSSYPPLCGAAYPEEVYVEGRTAGKSMLLVASVADEHYAGLVGIRLLAGRGIASSDRAGRMRVAVANEALVRQIWPGPAGLSEALGQRIRTGANGEWLTIVGVMSNGRQVLNAEPHPEAMMPYRQSPVSTVHVLVRTAVPPSTVAAAVRSEAQALDPDLPVRGPSTIEDLKENFYPMAIVYGVGAFAAIATLLSVVGLYGVVSFLVHHRTREIGLRVALGAGTGSVLRLVLGESIRLAMIGAGAGLLGAFALSRVLAHYLQDVSPADPIVFGSVAGVMVAVAAAAGATPALRACRVDPATALRSD